MVLTGPLSDGCLYDGACKQDDTAFYCTFVLGQQCVSSRYGSLKCVYVFGYLWLGAYEHNVTVCVGWHTILKAVWR